MGTAAMYIAISMHKSDPTRYTAQCATAILHKMPLHLAYNINSHKLLGYIECTC